MNMFFFFSFPIFHDAFVCMTCGKRGKLLCFSCHVQTGSLEIKFYSTFFCIAKFVASYKNSLL